MKFNMIWVDRKFTLDQPIDLFPAIVERLRGTPARLEELVRGIPKDKLICPENGQWSLQDHVGHLVRAEGLWMARLEEFLRREKSLKPADLKNNALENANRIPIDQILADFRSYRRALLEKLDVMTEQDAALSSLHPRLHTPMRVIDMAYFAAEHDDHHLACITRIKQIK